MFEELLKKPLSNKDILGTVKHPTTFIIYPDLLKYSHIDQVFNGNRSILLLYMNTSKMGHWCCINKLKNNMIEFYDPYGYYVDIHLKKVVKGQEYKYLSKLLLDSKYKLSYNEYSFQLRKSNINTCGRHCIVRINNIHLSLNNYKKIFDSFTGLFTPDEIVCILTYYL